MHSQLQLGGRREVFSYFTPHFAIDTWPPGWELRIAGEVLRSHHTGWEKAQNFAYFYEHEKKSPTLTVTRAGLLLSENIQLCVARFW